MRAYSIEELRALNATSTDEVHFAGSVERKSEGLRRRRRTVPHQEPTSHRIEYDENYAHGKDGHKD